MQILDPYDPAAICWSNRRPRAPFREPFMPDAKNFPPEWSPGRFIEKVSLATGEVLDVDILPKQLLVQHHRDYHVVDVYSRFLMSRLVKVTGDPERVTKGMKEVRKFGHKAMDVLAKVSGMGDPKKLGKALLGLKAKEYYFRFKKSPLTHEEVETRIAKLRQEAARKLAAVRKGKKTSLRVLLTGGTGFIGKEILWQAANDPDVVEMVVLIRPKEIRDRKTKQVVRVDSPADRGRQLLAQLWLEDHPARDKFRFIDGDIEKPDLGIDAAERARLARSLTHVIHCAASVAFDDPYEESFKANVLGTLNALAFSLSLQNAEGSPFVAHTSIETSYIHGRQTREPAREDEIVFPRNFYNNYYELTKAMGSIETDRFMLERGLRVTQLCPAIVIGESGTGNNRGDTKVVNAPVNAFGRAKQALGETSGTWSERSKTWMIAKLACIFPGDPSAELNLVPVDRVVMGIIAALKRPEAVGERVHLATDNRVTSEGMRNICQEEIDVKVKLAEPTMHRNVTLPVLTKVLSGMGQERLANTLKTLGTIFGGYSEWGQPIHEVGKDVEVLGLPLPRPNTEHAVRMLCRHNRFVQDFGQVRDLDEISRRERIWHDFLAELREATGQEPGALAAADFQKRLNEAIELKAFEWKMRKKTAPR